MTVPHLSELFNGVAQQITDAARAFQALAQNLDPSLADYISAFSEATTEAKRLDALRRLANNLGLFNIPGAHKEEEVLASLLLAERRSHDLQRVRLGLSWITDLAGRSMEIAPDQYFDLRSIEAFWTYLRQNARNLLEDKQREELVDPALLDAGSPAFGEAASAEAREIRRAVERKAYEARTHERELIEQDLCSHLMRRASPKERELMMLLMDGATSAEAAQELGIHPTTIRQLRFRLKKKLQAM